MNVELAIETVEQNVEWVRNHLQEVREWLLVRMPLTTNITTTYFLKNLHLLNS